MTVGARENRQQRSGCPIATTLSLVGDRWTLLIVRDMLCGKSKFGAFQDSPEKIPTNILTSRLQQMREDGLIEKRAYQEHPLRYEYTLTPKGRGLIPILQNISLWANEWEQQTWVSPEFFMELKP